MIDTAAGVAEAIEVADFHLVEAAAPRLHAEHAEKGLLGFQCLDGDDLGAAPPATQRDLVLIGGPPALQGRRTIEHGAGHPVPATFSCRSRRERLLLALRISMPKHKGTLGGDCTPSIGMPSAWSALSSADTLVSPRAAGAVGHALAILFGMIGMGWRATAVRSPRHV